MKPPVNKLPNIIPNSCDWKNSFNQNVVLQDNVSGIIEARLCLAEDSTGENTKNCTTRLYLGETEKITLTLNSLPENSYEGTYYLIYYVKDQVNNELSGILRSYKIDNKKPIVSIEEDENWSDYSLDVKAGNVRFRVTQAGFECIYNNGHCINQQNGHSR